MLRPEYYYANLFLKGTSSNCLRVRHFDHDKEMNRPDNPQSAGGVRPVLRKWFKENNVTEPTILLSTIHEYFAPVVADSGPGVYFLINPEAYGGPKNKYFTEETSEYHRNNIDKHPEFKKFMDEWTSLSAKRHQQFELDWKAREYHKLNLSDVIIKDSDMTLINSDNDISKQVKDLKELNNNDKKTSWVIRAGSFVEKQNALKLIKKLEYIKEKSFLLKINKQNKFFYTVNIGPFFSSSETKKIFLDIINKEEFKNSFIIESNY